MISQQFLKIRKRMFKENNNQFITLIRKKKYLETLGIFNVQYSILLFVYYESTLSDSF